MTKPRLKTSTTSALGTDRWTSRYALLNNPARHHGPLRLADTRLADTWDETRLNRPAVLDIRQLRTQIPQGPF